MLGGIAMSDYVSGLDPLPGGEVPRPAENPDNRFRNKSQIGMSPCESMAALQMAALRDENDRLRAALAYYAKPRTFGKGEHSVFIDDSGVAKAALNEPRREREQARP